MLFYKLLGWAAGPGVTGLYALGISTSAPLCSISAMKIWLIYILHILFPSPRKSDAAPVLCGSEGSCETSGSIEENHNETLLRPRLSTVPRDFSWALGKVYVISGSSNYSLLRLKKGAGNGAYTCSPVVRQPSRKASCSAPNRLFCDFLLYILVVTYIREKYFRKRIYIAYCKLECVYKRNKATHGKNRLN